LNKKEAGPGMKILVTGDIHIGKRSSAINDNPVWISTKHTWELIIDYSISHYVDLVILTGDIVDRDNRFFEAVSPLQQGLDRLAEKGITVCMVAGNHDYDVLPEIIRMKEYSRVYLLGKEGKWEDRIIDIDGQQLQVIGWSFPSQYQMSDPVRELPVECVRADMPTIGIVHGDALSPNGKYAPVNLASLKMERNIDAWFLGHIHKPQILCDAPLILYPGSPHALSPKETGVHGPYVLMIDKSGVTGEQISLSPIRYERLNVDVSSVTDKDSYRQLLLNVLKDSATLMTYTNRLKQVVYDIDVVGEYDDPRLLKQWETEVLDYSGSTSFTEKIRCINYRVNPRIKIESFIHDPSYMGVLANAILAMECGKENDFVDQLKKQWKDKYEMMMQSNTYTSLSAMESSDLDHKMNVSILEECKRLFTELYNQRKDAN